MKERNQKAKSKNRKSAPRFILPCDYECLAGFVLPFALAQALESMAMINLASYSSMRSPSSVCNAIFDLSLAFSQRRISHDLFLGRLRRGQFYD
jgi:hypothetical protein